MEDAVLSVEVRGKKEKVKDLRINGFIPAVVYNHGKTQELKIKKKSFLSLFPSAVNESVIFSLELDGKKEDVFVKDYQRHVVTGEFLSLDFFKITKGEKIKTHIHLEFLGTPPGIAKGGVIEVFIRDLEIETLPKYLTSSLEIDVSTLEIGDAIHIQDIKCPPETSIDIEGNPIVFQVTEVAKFKSDGEDIDTNS